MKQGRLLPLVVACALFIENMDSTAIATSLPAMARDLGVQPIALKLALTVYLLALAVFIPVSGWIADRFGARNTFAVAIGVFLLGSLCCAASTTLAGLVGARFVQGMGGALMVPVGRLVLLRAIPKHELVHALSWMTIPALLAPMIGPPLGGYITTYFHWRWIFGINLPIGLLGMALAWRFIPDLRASNAPLDWRGFALSGLGLALAIFGFSTLGRHLVTTRVAIACLAGGLLALAGYVVHARRHPHPLLDLRLLRIPTYRVGVLGGGVFRISIGAIPFLLPLMLQLGFGLDPLHSGLLTFVSAIGAIFTKTITAGVLRRFGFRSVLWVNSLICSSLLACYGLFRADTPHALIVGVLVLAGCFRSLQFTSLNAIAFADVEADAMSQAASLSGMVQQLSLALGVALAGYALQVIGDLRGFAPADAGNFGPAFAFVAAIGASSALAMRSLAKDAGQALAGRAVVGAEIAEPKPEQRPGT